MTAPHPPLDPTWWERPELQTALATRDVGKIYRWLQRNGWSQTLIGSKTLQSQGEISEILSGRQVKAYEVLERISDAFDIPRGLMGLAYSSTVETDKPQDLTFEDRQSFAGSVASVAFGSATPDARKWLPKFSIGSTSVPDMITLADIEQVRSMTREFRKLDQRFGGGAAVDASRGFYGYARHMLNSKAEDSVSRDLKVSLADFSSMVAWSFHDIGNQLASRRYLMNALVLAREADEPSLISSILYRLGRVNMHEGHPAEALKMLQIGQISAQDAGDPAEIARLHANEALAYAMLGKETHVRDALARAEYEMGRADSSRVSPWTTLYFTPGDYTGHEALVFNMLANATKDQTQKRQFSEVAIDYATKAIAESGPDRPPRSRVFDRIVLATNLLRTGEVNSGVSAAVGVLQASQAIRSGRGARRLGEIADAAVATKDSAAQSIAQAISTHLHTTRKAITA